MAQITHWSFRVAQNDCPAPPRSGPGTMGRDSSPANPEEHAAGERRLAQHRHGRRVRHDRRRLLRRRDRAGLAARVAGARDRRERGAARQGRTTAPQRPQPLPRCRPGRRHAGRLLLGRLRCQHPLRAVGRLAGGPGRQRGPREHAGPGPRHHRDQLPVARRRRADPEAAGPAAGRGLLADRGRAAQRDRHDVPPDHLAAVEVDGPARAPAGRRPEGQRRVDQPGGAARPRRGPRVAEQRRAPASSTRSSGPASARSAR